MPYRVPSLGLSMASLLFLLCMPALLLAATRDALVIGVNQYEAPLSPLANAERDAQSVADALQARGFQVRLLLNPDRAAVLAAVQQLATDNARSDPRDPAGVILVYFAGHGIEYLGERATRGNYLLPAGSSLERLGNSSLLLPELLLALKTANRRNNIVILDACRDVVSRGLQQIAPALPEGVSQQWSESVQMPEGDFLVQYAAPFGAKTPDGVPGDGGPFARALVAQLQDAPDLEAALRDTRRVLHERHALDAFMLGNLKHPVPLRPAAPGVGTLVAVLLLLALGSVLWLRRALWWPLVAGAGGVVSGAGATLSDPQTGRRLATLRPGQRLKLGRSPTADLRFEALAVSQEHALLGLDADGPWIEDRSSNGLWYGKDQPLPKNTRVRLSLPCTVYLGDHRSGLRIE